MMAGSKIRSTRGMTSLFALAGLAGAALSVASLGGCREDPAALQAIKKAGHSINTVAGGAEAAVSIDRQETAFKQALSELGSAKLDPSNPLASATGILTAASQLGSAGTASETAQASLNTLSGLRSELRSSVLQWASVNAVADSAKYDASPRLAEIDAQLTAARGEQQQAQERLAAVVREQARRMSAAESQSVLAKALEAKRQCDELRLSLAKIEADATLLEPKKLGLNQRLQELEIGIKSVEGERVRVQKRGEEAASVQTQARTQINATAGVVDGFAKKISEEREKVLGPAIDQVIEICKKSASSASSAKGPMYAAVAKLRLGEVLLVKAGEAREHAALMAELASVKPALAAQTSYAEAAEAALEVEKTATAEAKEALEAARSGYKALRVKGEADEATQAALIKYLTQIGGLTPDDAENPPAAEGTPAEGEGPEKGPATPGDAAAMDPEVKTLLTELGQAVDAVDVDRVSAIAFFDGATEEESSAMKPVFAATLKLDEACKSKFKVSFGDHMSKMAPGGGDGEIQSMPGSAELADAKAEVDGDKATVTLASGLKMSLKKVDGVWKVNLSDADDTPQKRAQIAAMASGLVPAMEEITADVKADKFASIDEVAQAIMAKLQAIMTGGGKGGGGAGG